MAVWFTLDIPMTTEQSDAVMRELGLNNQPAPGQIFHVEGASTGGVRVMDVLRITTKTVSSQCQDETVLISSVDTGYPPSVSA